MRRTLCAGPPPLWTPPRGRAGAVLPDWAFGLAGASGGSIHRLAIRGGTCVLDTVVRSFETSWLPSCGDAKSSSCHRADFRHPGPGSRASGALQRPSTANSLQVSGITVRLLGIDAPEGSSHKTVRESRGVGARRRRPSSKISSAATQLTAAAEISTPMAASCLVAGSAASRPTRVNGPQG